METVVALVVYIAAVFLPGEDEARWGIFTEKQACEAAVARVRSQGVFATDSVKVEMPKPKGQVS
jgi:hypothetical protein